MALRRRNLAVNVTHDCFQQRGARKAVFADRRSNLHIGVLTEGQREGPVIAFRNTEKLRIGNDVHLLL
jgi:hypothetical protein